MCVCIRMSKRKKDKPFEKSVVCVVFTRLHQAALVTVFVWFCVCFLAGTTTWAALRVFQVPFVA